MNINLSDYYLDIEMIEKEKGGAYNVYTLFNNMVSYFYETTHSMSGSVPNYGKDKAKIIFNSLLISGYLKNIRDGKIDKIMSAETGK